MLLTLSFGDDIRKATALLDDVQRKQIPFASSVALNNTAAEVQEALRQGTSKFDRPKPLTQKGTYLKRSTKLNLVAEVGLKQRSSGGPVDEYLQAEIDGGHRADKRSEILLRRAGLLPAGFQTRPGSGARLDAYGNMSRGQIVQILSYFRAFGGIEQSGRDGRKKTLSARLNRGNVKKAAIEYFVVPAGYPGLAMGIWQRKARKVSPVLIFIKPPTYRKRYDFYGIALKTAQSRINQNFNDALRHALDTAR